MKKIAIMGSGGFAREVAFLIEEINKQNQEWELLGFIDRNTKIGSSCGRYGVFQSDDWLGTVDFELQDPRSDDGVLHLAKVGSYQANPWGLHDMHGNVSEWTRSDYTAYPNLSATGDPSMKKVARGGSWADRPRTAGSTVRMPYESHQAVYNVGFRVIVE